MANWQRVVINAGSGVVGGVASKIAEDFDMDREKKEAKKLEFFSRASTYIDYGVGVLGIIGSLTGYLKGDWETRALVLGGVLAGRRGYSDIKEASKPAAEQRQPGGIPYGRWERADMPPPPPGPGGGLLYEF
jgi:hypothetical protein